LVFHDKKLIGYGLLVNANKTQIITTAFGSMLDTRKKVAVVDGANDLELFNIADLKVAFNAQRVVVDRADISITKKDLRALPDLLTKLRCKHNSEANLKRGFQSASPACPKSV